jgi:hypothetical protein
LTIQDKYALHNAAASRRFAAQQLAQVHGYHHACCMPATLAY